MSELGQNIIIALLGLSIGYVTSLLLAKFNAKMALQRELKNAIASKKIEGYVALWELCDQRISSVEEMGVRRDDLNNWYAKGGGLFLPFKATNHFFGAVKILEKKDISALDDLHKEFTWLRTEMKFEVGSYTRKEADTSLPNVKEN